MKIKSYLRSVGTNILGERYTSELLQNLIVTCSFGILNNSERITRYPQLVNSVVEMRSARTCPFSKQH